MILMIAMVMITLMTMNVLAVVMKLNVVIVVMIKFQMEASNINLDKKCVSFLVMH